MAPASNQQQMFYCIKIDFISAGLGNVQQWGVRRGQELMGFLELGVGGTQGSVGQELLDLCFIKMYQKM